MATILSNLWRAPSPKEQFLKLEKKVSAQFAKTGGFLQRFQKAQTALEKANTAMEEFNAKNSGLQIAEDSVENKVFEGRLKQRKWFTVGADALVSIAAIKLIFGETLGIGLTTPVALTVGSFFSYLLLKLAIGYKNDDKADQENGLMAFWNKYSHLVPLLIVPILSLFLVQQAPGNPANFIWVVFLIVAFMLNLKAVSYAKDYKMMEQTMEVRNQKKALQNSIDKPTAEIQNINDQMVNHREQIEITATDLLRSWNEIPPEDRPKELSLSPQYLFVLNNRIYYRQVLPIPPLVINETQGEVAQYENFWLNTTGTSINRKPTPPVINEPEPAGVTENETNSDSSKNDAPFDTYEEVEDAPSFGQAINDSNKYV